MSFCLRGRHAERVKEIEEKQKATLQNNSPTCPLPEKRWILLDQQKSAEDVKNIEAEIDPQDLADILRFTLRVSC